MGLIENFSHLIKVEHKCVHSLLLFIEKRTGLKQESTIYCKINHFGFISKNTFCFSFRRIRPSFYLFIIWMES